MCGLVGIIHEQCHVYIKKMTNAIAHRGPDDSGYYSDELISLGHRRLSIQDLTVNGHQPMISDDGRYVLIFNGEIYNHWEIRESYKDKYKFKSSSDTETVLYGYIEYGVDLFAKLNGIFALAIYDTFTHDVIIARDQFGVKPLYYYQDENAFLFGSEIKSFLVYPQLDRSLDYEALCNYLHFLYSPGEKTPFSKVKKLLPGHYMSIKASLPNQKQVTKYYEIPFDNSYSNLSETELIDALEQKLIKAVQRQLLSDVPVGFFLSGGLDSSLIVAIARKILPKNSDIRCYTIDTGEEDYEGFVSDIHYARKAANHLNVDLVEIKSEPTDIVNLDKMVYHLDEPQADIAPIHVLNICQQARNDGYIVLLGGTAGDDLFSGYRKHQSLYFERYFKYIPGFAKDIFSNVIKSIKSNNPTFRRIKKVVAELHKSTEERLLGYYAWLPLNTNKGLFKPKISETLNDYNPEQILVDSLKNISKEKSLLNKMLFWDMKYFLTDHNLNYTDKLSMATGVEVRVPFLDLELVDFSTKIPPSMKLKGKTTKYLLRKVAERYLPHDIIYRPKTGFGSPVREWVLGDLQTEINERLSRNNIEKQGIFSYEAVANLIEDNQNGKIDASYTILSLLTIDSWIKQFER
jgi:asparagine synthase (glutamine-hydrolysing)